MFVCAYAERPLFYRERADGLYHPLAYVTFMALRETLISIPISLIYTPMIFYVVQYQGSFVLFWLVALAGIATANAIAAAAVSLCPGLNSATIVITMYNLVCFFSAGQTSTLATLPIYWKWLSRFVCVCVCVCLCVVMYLLSCRHAPFPSCMHACMPQPSCTQRAPVQSCTSRLCCHALYDKHELSCMGCHTEPTTFVTASQRL